MLCLLLHSTGAHSIKEKGFNYLPDGGSKALVIQRKGKIYVCLMKNVTSYKKNKSHRLP